MTSIIVCIPNPIANKTNSHFRGRMEIMAKAMEFATGEKVVVTTSANQWQMMTSGSTTKTYLHLGDSYGGPEIGGWNWNEYGRMSEDPATYEGWINDVRRCWQSIRDCPNPVALEFPFPDKFKFMASSTLRRPEWVGTPELKLFEDACSKLERFKIHSDSNKIREYYSPWKDCVEKGWNQVVLGDSHGLTMWRPGAVQIYRKGETLHGAIKRGFKSIIEDTIGLPIQRVQGHGIFNYGNIDLRHHIPRFEIEPTVNSLVSKYVEQIELCGFENVTVAAPFPVCSDDRVISKSVMYRPKVLNAKGKEVNGELQPFAGSWELRDRAYRYFEAVLGDSVRRRGWNYHVWPRFFFDQKHQFNPEVMEGGRPGATGGRGIHLSPEFYYWDLFNNKLNEYPHHTESTAMENFFS